MLYANEDDRALPDGVTARLVLVRHGEPEDSARGRCYGSLDVGLSEQGRQQIRETSRWLKALPLDAVYTSPSRRAHESAELIADEQGLGIHIIEDLREIDFGEFEGLTYDEVAARYPDEYRHWMERPTEITFPGGESFAMMRERVSRTATDILLQHGGQTIAAVTHGGVNRIILADALRLDSRDIFRLDQSYGAVSIIDYYSDIPSVRLVNRWP